MTYFRVKHPPFKLVYVYHLQLIRFSAVENQYEETHINNNFGGNNSSRFHGNSEFGYQREIAGLK